MCAVASHTAMGSHLSNLCCATGRPLALSSTLKSHLLVYSCPTNFMMETAV